MQPSLNVYGGEASSIGTVRRFPVTSWPQFVKEILGHPAALNVTRDQFHAMPHKLRNAAKRVRYVTPAWFKASPSHRAYEAAKGISLIVLDIDDPEQARRLTPTFIRTSLDPFACAAYLTASATPSQPKLRIMVPAAPGFPVKSYGAAVNRLASLLGLKSVTSESRVSVQPMYLPTIFRDEDPVDVHPLIVSVLDGQAMSPGDDVALDDGTSDEIEHLRLPMEDVTREDAVSALAAVSPDCNMHDWIRIGGALHHQFGEEDGFQLWNEWSARGKKYDGAAAIARRWKNIHGTTKGRAPATIRTLFYIAEQAGWKGATAIAGRRYNTVADWMKSTARTEADLTKEGLARIAACDLQSPTAKAALLSHLQSAFKRVGVKLSSSSLRKSLSKIERRDAPAAPTEQTPKWAQGISYVQGTDEFYHRLQGVALPPEVLDRTYGRKLMIKDEEGSRAVVRPSDFLLNTVQIPIVSHYLYDPTHPEDTFVERDGRKFINTYLPTYPEPDPAGAAQAQDIFEGHLNQLIAEADYRRTALDFLTFIVQHPGRKIRWAWLLQGAQGCGKTAIMEAMTAVLGHGNARIIDAGLLFKPYNPWATGSQLVGMEEIRVVGHNRHEVMNRLKPCITNDTLSIDRKHKDLQYVPNITNYLMFTNHHDSLAVSEEDRRYFVVNSSFQTKAEVKERLGPAYFKKLFACFSDNAAGLRHYFENRKISASFDPDGEAPVTRYLMDLAGAAATPLTAAIKDALEAGEHPLVKLDLISTRALKSQLAGENVPRFSDQQLAVALRELDYVQLSRTRLRDGERHQLWGRRTAKMTAASAEHKARTRIDGKEDLV